MPRQEFPIEVKRELAASAGHRCSMPSCRAPTAGPSTSRISGTSNIGVAAHINAASVEGPRYDASLPPERLRDPWNGIWLCQTDAKRIDDDENRYTVELLRAWRDIAQDLAATEQGRPESQHVLGLRTLVPFRRSLESSVDIRQESYDFLVDIGAPRAWDAHFELMRMVLYEIAINAVEHGHCRGIHLTSGVGVVELRDDGRAFGLDDLRAGGNGGHSALEALEAHARGTFSLRYQRSCDENIWSIVDEVALQGAASPCSIVGTSERSHMYETALAEARAMSKCQEIHVYPGPLWSFSDWNKIFLAIYSLYGERRLILHGTQRDSPVSPLAERLAHRPNVYVAD